MSSPTTFNLSRVLEAIGARDSSALPNFDPRVMTPTLIVGDMSKSFGSQQFESRGFGGGRVLGKAGEFGRVELLANAPGGIVIEKIYSQAGAAGFAGRFSFVEIVDSTRAFDTFALASQIEVGGSPVRSVLSAGSSIAPGLNRLLFNNDLIGQFKFEDIAWFLPSGSAFNIEGPAFTELQANILWRELPQAPGTP